MRDFELEVLNYKCNMGVNERRGYSSEQKKWRVKEREKPRK